MRLLKVLLGLFLFPVVCFAQGGPDNWAGGLPLGNGKWLTSRAASNQTEVQVLRVNTSGNLEVSPSLDTNITFNAPYGVSYPASTVITPATAATAVGAAPLTNHSYIVAAAAPTANFVQLPEASTVLGEVRRVINTSANPVAIVPASGDSANATGAATPYACSAASTCSCEAATSALWGCSQ